jgi:hypothetical protein
MMLSINTLNLILLIVEEKDKEEYLRIVNDNCENYLSNKLKMKKNIRDNKLFNTISLESVETRICFVKMFFSTFLSLPFVF